MDMITIVIFLIRLVIPMGLLLCAFFSLDFATVLGKIIILASSAILLHFFIEIGLSVCLKKNQETEPFPKCSFS